MKHIFRIQLYMDEKFHSRSMYRLQKTTAQSQGGASQVNRPSTPPSPPPGAHHRGHRFQSSLSSWSQHAGGRPGAAGKGLQSSPSALAARTCIELLRPKGDARRALAFDNLVQQHEEGDDVRQVAQEPEDVHGTCTWRVSVKQLQCTQQLHASPRRMLLAVVVRQRQDEHRGGAELCVKASVEAPLA